MAYCYEVTPLYPEIEELPLARGMFFLLVLLSGGILGLSVSGCDDDYPPPSDLFNRVVVIANDFDCGAPQAGVKLILMDAENNRPVTDPVVTGADGRVSFENLPESRYVVLAYPGGGIGIYHQPESFWLDEKVGASAYAVLGSHDADLFAPARTPPLHVVTVFILTFRHSHYEDALPRIAGQVVDAVSGESLNRVFVSLPSHVTAYAGLLAISDDVTGPDGQFLVAGIPFAADPISGNIFQVQPLIISREGYTPLAWFHQLPNGEDNLDISGVRIALQTLSGDGGSLTGFVSYLGEPVVGQRVGLAALGVPPVAGKSFGSPSGGDSDSTVPDELQPLSGVGLVGQVAVTDSTGAFRFAGLSPGYYYLHPSFLVGDDYVFLSQPADRPYEVITGETTTADTLRVLQSIRPYEPEPGSIVNTPVRLFHWSAVAEADSYRVYLDRGVLGTFTGTQAQLPEGEEITADDHVWNVVAFTRDGVYVGTKERYSRFTVRLIGK